MRQKFSVLYHMINFEEIFALRRRKLLAYWKTLDKYDDNKTEVQEWQSKNCPKAWINKKW